MGQTVRRIKPVAKSCVVVLAALEPAIVQDKKLDPEVCRFLREGDQPVLVQIKIRGLPAVDKHRAVRKVIFAAGDMVTDEPVVAVA